LTALVIGRNVMEKKRIVRFCLLIVFSSILILLTAGCVLLQGAGKSPAITVDPSSGPTGTVGTIKIVDAEPGQSVTLQIGQGSVNGIIDQNGEFVYDHRFSGQVGDEIQIVAIIGNANQNTVSTSFKIIAPPEQVFSDVSDDDLQAKGGGAKISVNPEQGPTGTRATITIRGAKPNQPVTLKYMGSINAYDTDENGALVVQDTMVGRVGDVILIEAIIGNPTDEYVTTTFTITMPPDGVFDGEGNPLQTQGDGPEISVNPNKGPTGTQAKIIIRGAAPNQPVTIQHSRGSISAQTDENGYCEVEDTFYGQVGDVIHIEATIGNANEQHLTTTFEITAPLEQTFLCAVTVDQDPAGHKSFVGMPEDGLVLQVREGSLIIEGPAPWVNVLGDFNDDGSFSSSGTGTVAGFSDIAVIFEGTVSMQYLEGTYTMGAEGGLPGGQPITYQIQGQPEEVASSENDMEDILLFFDTFNTFQQSGDSDGMFALLHSEVLARYGDEACQTYLDSVVNPSVEIEVLDVTNYGPWLWEIDEVSTEIEDTYSVAIKIHSEQGETQQEIHVAFDEDGALGWFTDCGDPLE
jgi:hypothetical protein